MANMHLVTGFAGREHVTSIDQGLLNSYIIGDVEAVMKRGNQFEASIISNNIIRVKDGDLLMQGRFARLNDDSYVDLAIENGTQGYFRNDLIVARYQKDAITAVETVDLVVIKGENAASDPADPAHVKGNIKSGKDFVNDVPLWRVSLEGLSVTGLTCLYSTFSASLSGLLSHAERHSSGGADPITPSSIGAASAFSVSNHIENRSNPHQVTATQVPVSEGVVSVLGNSGEWSVDGVLAQIGAMFNSGATLYQWRRSKRGLVLQPGTNLVNISYPATIYYSEEITIDANGYFALVNPSSFTIQNEYSHDGTIPTGYFCFGRSSGGASVYVYKTTDSTKWSSTYDELTQRTSYGFYDITTWRVGVVDDIVSDIDQNAHYEGEVDAEGYTYTAIETVSTTVPKIATGSYIGTDTSGIGNPNSLVLSFSPKLVWITGGGYKALFFASGLTETYAQYGWLYCNTSSLSASSSGYALLDANTLKWYYGSYYPENQMNKSGTEYKWVAIG